MVHEARIDYHHAEIGGRMGRAIPVFGNMLSVPFCTCILILHLGIHKLNRACSIHALGRTVLIVSSGFGALGIIVSSYLFYLFTRIEHVARYPNELVGHNIRVPILHKVLEHNFFF